MHLLNQKHGFTWIVLKISKRIHCQSLCNIHWRQIKRVSFADHKTILFLSSLITSTKSYLALKTNREETVLFYCISKSIFWLIKGCCLFLQNHYFFSVFSRLFLPTSIGQKYLPCHAFQVVSHDRNEMTSSNQRCS